MADYTSTVYASVAAAQVAINAVAAGKLSQVVAFMEDDKQKFLVVVSA